jgi:hypothetical protein
VAAFTVGTAASVLLATGYNTKGNNVVVQNLNAGVNHIYVDTVTGVTTTTGFQISAGVAVPDSQEFHVGKGETLYGISTGGNANIRVVVTN